MRSLDNFFTQDIATQGGMSTQDTVTALVPLLEQLADLHDSDLVGPTDHFEKVFIEKGCLWFEVREAVAPQFNFAEVERRQSVYEGALSVVSETVRIVNPASSSDTFHRELRIVDPSEDIEFEQPAYVYGYSAWEQLVDHHDAAVDAFLVGLLLAGLALGIDPRRPDDLERLVASRQNLFDLRPDLHPVVARTIVQLTELDRNRRATDLTAIASSLVNYRGESVELEYELASIEGFQTSDPQGKQATILSRLQKRLFDLSRRNRLLHFRGTSATANLTLGSVPLTQDVRTIDEAQLLTWGSELQSRLIDGKPLLLNDHLNFVEALYLPMVLDRIRSEARRDETEYGFAQLRLVTCFLRWSNLKEDPPQRYDSPLVLLPVKLRREKGVQDQYYLEATSSVAEVNPAVRYHLKSLYGLDLPESIDLRETDLDELYQWFQTQLDRSGQGVHLEKLDRPSVEAVYLRARRKMEQHRRRARSRSRGYRTYDDIDYSYDASTYDPLGIKLFLSKIRPESEQIAATDVDRDAEMVSDLNQWNQSPPRRRVRQEGTSINHHQWEFDLCSVTVANFRYRRMSLVRDYESALNDELSSPAFDATFSLSPKPVDREVFSAPVLPERYDILPADPSQAAAIGAARSGSSYIIQGPPGTGKSQTIANLIADYVGRGKRVLFVCEKRAAIDVVYARLCTQGLQDVCTIIHDALADKKPFVLELARTYNGFLEVSSRDDEGARENALLGLEHQLEPLARFGKSMLASCGDSDVSIVAMLERLFEMDVDKLHEFDESLPDASQWQNNVDGLRRLADLLKVLPDFSAGVFSKHPLSNLDPRISDKDRPRQLVSDRVDSGVEILGGFQKLAERCDFPVETLQSMENVSAMRDYVRQATALASNDCLALSDPFSDLSRRLESMNSTVAEKQKAVDEARQENKHWKQLLDRSSAEIAKEQLDRMENQWTRWLKPSWWKLTGTLKRQYRIDAHPIKPLWSQVLDRLLKQYAAEDELQQAQDNVTKELGIANDHVWLETQVDKIRALVKDLPLWLEEYHRELIHRPDLRRQFATFTEIESLVDRWDSACYGVFVDFEHLSVMEIESALSKVESALAGLPDFLDCLAIVRDLPRELQSAIRRFPGRLDHLEGRLIQNSLLQMEQHDREFARFGAEHRDTLAARGFERYDELLSANAAMIRGRVRGRFLHNVALTNRKKSELSSDEEQFAAAYKKGRRILEHEFGKSMRYRAIRDLVSGASGTVVRDLKPVWLMSPLSVADTLPLDRELFDVVIFDEASQVTLESAAPTLFRASQVIIVGDEMQLPPTSFFESQSDGEDDELRFEEEGETHEYSLAADSLLNHAGRNLASTMLSWHYRSRNETLISFSNWRFYHGRLLTVPEEERLQPNQQLLKVEKPDDAQVLTPLALSRAVSYHLLPNGVYERRRNRDEADYIAQLTRGILSHPDNKTLGIIAFSEAQQDEIERSLRRLAEEDDDFRQQLDAELEREEDGQFVGLLVKNLENIQGDERDIIVLSICYGPDSDGRMVMNFGPINRSGGEKRLNVAFTRAKHHMMLISSIEPSRITNEHNEGANCLKNYLRYAAAASIGDSEELELVLRGIALGRNAGDRDAGNRTSPESTNSAAIQQLADRLKEEGFLCDFLVGHSGFRCDLAIYREGDPVYRLGVLLDGALNYSLNDPIEREILRPRLLENFGWKVDRVLLKDLWKDSEGVVQGLLEKLRRSADDAAESS